jgi:O-antigen ligase
VSTSTINPLRAFPADEWRNFRLLVFIASFVLFVLAASGVLEMGLFTQPTTIKYGVTVLGAAFLVLLTTVRAPLRLLVGLALIGAPFNFVKTLHGVQVTPLLAIDVLALIVALPRRAGGNSAIRLVSPVFILLLLPAVVSSSGVGLWLTWLLLTVATGWLVYLVAQEPGGLLFVGTMLAISVVIQGGLAIWEFRTGHQLNLYTTSGFSVAAHNYFFNYGSLTRASGALPDPIGLGQVLALCIPVMIGLAAALRRAGPAFAAVCVAAIGALGLVLTLSRMSIVGAIVGSLVALLLLPRGVRVRTWLYVSAVAIVVVALSLSFGGRQLTHRIQSIIHPTAAHVSTAQGDLTRVRIWKAAIKTGENHALTGVGFGNITNYLPSYGAPVTAAAHAHDTYLQFFGEAGVLGLVALLGVIAASFTDLARAFSAERAWVAGASGALIATLIAWVSDVEVRYVQVSAMVAVLLGVIAALATRARSSAPETHLPYS